MLPAPAFVNFRDGEETADVRLEIRGILVGVSLGFPDMEFIKVDGGGSLFSFEVCVMVPTDGEPAIVGNWLRVRRDVSDCFCIELAV